MKLLTVLMFLSLASCRFYEVDRDRLYRSPQPSPDQLEKYIHDYGIKTVINLRGENPEEKWWQSEKAILDTYHLNFVNISMSAKRLPHRADLIKLLDSFRYSPKPILVHCKAGADRTGEASALYEMIYMKKSKKEAMDMLSPIFGHFEKFEPAKDYFIKNVWVDEAWAYKDYDPCHSDYKFYDKSASVCGHQAQQKSSDDDEE